MEKNCMREHWGSRLGFILAALGSAIGLGTLWKFPYITGENGGGLFVLCYLLFTFFLGVPLFIGELLLGRRTQRGAVGVFAELSGEGSGWQTVGWLGVASSLFILAYYSVVAGWGLNYLMLSLNQFYEVQPIDQISGVFETLYQSGDISLFWAIIFLLMTFGVVFHGIRKGVELWSRILTTALLILLVAMGIYACTLEGFGQAVQFLFRVDFKALKFTGILEALGLSLFTLSLAQGIILTYGSYLRPSDDLPKMSLIVGSAVIIVSIMTALVLFPVIFTFNLPLQAGTGLVFETLPLLFASLPGSMILSTFFFALFVFTALTSAIALLEVLVANLIDLYHFSRKKAVIFSTLAAFIVGIPCALAGSQDLFKAWLPMYGVNFFGSLDAIVSNWILPAGGFLVAFYLGWHLKKDLVKEAFYQGTAMKGLFSVWFFVIRWVAPVAIALIFLEQGLKY
ncbi:MAG: sodium-dependent transporter [Chlamydiales bacterium]